MALGLLIAALVLAGLVLWMVLQGAPYVPTRRSVITKLFASGVIRKNDSLYDMGSGDGRVIDEALKQNITRAHGIEINPLLYLWCRMRFLRKKQVSIQLGNFWDKDIPEDVTVVFVFLAGPFMKRFESYIQHQVTLRQRPLRIISYGFKLPITKPTQTLNACHIYDLD